MTHCDLIDGSPHDGAELADLEPVSVSEFNRSVQRESVNSTASLRRVAVG